MIADTSVDRKGGLPLQKLFVFWLLSDSRAYGDLKTLTTRILSPLARTRKQYLLTSGFTTN